MHSSTHQPEFPELILSSYHIWCEIPLKCALIRIIRRSGTEEGGGGWGAEDGFVTLSSVISPKRICVSWATDDYRPSNQRCWVYFTIPINYQHPPQIVNQWDLFYIMRDNKFLIFVSSSLHGLAWQGVLKLTHAHKSHPYDEYTLCGRRRGIYVRN